MKRKVPLCCPARSDSWEAGIPRRGLCQLARETRLFDLTNRSENLSLCVRSGYAGIAFTALDSMSARLAAASDSLLLGGGLLGGSLLRSGLRRPSSVLRFLHCHRSLLVAKTYLLESDRHESTGPCANSYQIFQHLEEELRKKWSFFLQIRWNSMRLLKWNRYNTVYVICNLDRIIQ